MLSRSIIFLTSILLLAVHVNAQLTTPLRQGLVVVKNDRGKIIEQSNYVNDTLHGESIKWHQNGKLYIKCSYDKGRLDGEWFYYNKKGKLAIHSHFIEGVRDVFRSYWKNGNERIIAHFANGLIDGEMKTYYKNGKVESTVLYRRGGILSVLRKYDKNGNLIVLMYPIDTTRDRFTSIEYFDSHGKVKKRQTINERPISYYLFGPDVHRSGPLEGSEIKNE
jgi:antitoxin component YwqK of YwqJK toxin-antitoxin module